MKFKQLYVSLFITLGIVLFGLSGAASATSITPDPGGGGTTSTTTSSSSSSSNSTTDIVCPTGETSNQDLGTCAKCQASSESECVAGQSDPAAVTSCTKTSCDLIKSYVEPTINLLSALVGVSCVISLILAGIQYTTSAGDPGKASAAKSRIAMTLVAFISFIFLYAFLQFIVPGGVLNPGS